MRYTLTFLALATTLAACGGAQGPAPAPAAGQPASKPAASPGAAAPASGVPAAGTPASAAASGAPDQAAASGAEAPAEGYVYHSLGRRDPFVSLLHRGTDAERGVRTTDGLGTLGVGDVALKGIIHSEGVFVAMVQAPDRRTYVVRPNDQLRDARVKAITADEVVFLQHVTDPLSIVTEREVRKPLRPSEEGK